MYFDTRKAKVFYDTTFHGVNARPAKGAFLQGSGEMRRIEKTSLLVDEGPEVHVFTVDRGHVFSRHEIAEHADPFSNQCPELLCHDGSFHRGFQQFEWRAQWKAEQFNFVEGLFAGAFLQYRQGVRVFLRFEEHWCAHRLPAARHGGRLFPHEFVLALSRKTECVDSDQEHELFAWYLDPLYKVLKTFIGTISLAFCHDAPRELLFQRLDVHKAQVQACTLDCGQIRAVIDAGSLDGGTAHPGLVDIYLRAIEPAEIVDNRSHKLDGVIRLEEETLEGFYRKTGGVGFAERISAKTGNLSPHLFCQLPAVASFLAALEILFPEPFKGV